MFKPGQSVLYRGLDEHRQITAVQPVRVVQDDRQLIALWLPPGTSTMLPILVDHAPGTPRRWTKDNWTLERSSWRTEALILFRPAEHRATWVRWTADREFYGWYVNMQSPATRTRLGFDTRDHQLDIRVEPDRSWHWKDEAELDVAVEAGRLTAEEAAGVRKEGGRAVEQIERDEPPFSERWQVWRPNPAWDLPSLPDDWNDLSMYPQV